MNNECGSSHIRLYRCKIFRISYYFCTDVSCTAGGSQFAVLANHNSPDDATTRDGDGVILLFDVENPVPLAIWSVQKVRFTS